MVGFPLMFPVLLLFNLDFLYMLWFNFILGLNFIFLCFLGMVMYDNEFETKENKI